MLDSDTTPDLNAMSKSELQALQRQVQEALVKSEARRKQEALSAVERAVKEYGLTLQEMLTLASEGRQKNWASGKVEAAAKFRNPENPDEIWSGRGRRPLWFKAHLEAGKSEDDLRI